MNILAIDTTTTSCSAALHTGSDLIAKCKIIERSHTKLILPMIDEVLSDGGLTLSQITCIAFTAGPGSFTGIRIGFGVVQGLAFGADIPVLPVSSLETLAYTAIRKLQIKNNIHIVPMLDARMSEIYWAQFSYDSGILIRTNPDCVSAPETLKNEIKNRGIMIGDGLNYSERISNEFTTDATHINLFPEAQDIFNIAQPLIKKNVAIDIRNANPIYLRNQIMWEKRKKLR